MKRLSKNKVLALVIALVMIVSLFPMGIFSVSANTVQGIAIEDADGFAKMEPDGTYYLAKSITLTETYATEFTGKFNGNGKTITVSAPIFDQVMNATIENFTVASTAEVVTLTKNSGMVCSTAGGNTTLRNITNNVSLNSANTFKIAGIVGDFASDPDATEMPVITIDGCVNNGRITGAMRAGGIACGAFGTTATCNVNIKNCKNTGTISSGKSAGIIGLGYYFTGKLILDNCENSGAITSGDIAGGIVSHVGNVVSGVTITGCRNSGAVTSTKGGKQAGGIIGLCQISDLSISNCFNSGYIQNTITTQNATCGGIAGTVVGVVMERCGNTGEIRSTANAGGVLGSLSGSSIIRYCYNTGAAEATSVRAGGIVADANNSDTIITGCYNSGTITGKRTYETGEIFGKTVIPGITCDKTVSCPTGTSEQITNNYIKGTADYATTFTAADLASGKLAYDMNKAIGETVYYQNINANDENKDAFPVLDATHGYVFKNGDSVYSLRFHTLETASIRLSANKAERGIRFATAVNKADYDNLPADVKASISFGTLITPDSYLKVVQGGGYEFTKSGLEHLDTEKPYMCVETAEFIEELRGADNTTYYYFCGSITGIKADNYQWDYSAIGYISINGNEVYSADYATRNIAYVANAALNDPNGGYTDEEISMIRGYLPQN